MLIRIVNNEPKIRTAVMKSNLTAEFMLQGQCLLKLSIEVAGCHPKDTIVEEIPFNCSFQVCEGLSEET